jgi:hypothetical protein
VFRIIAGNFGCFRNSRLVLWLDLTDGGKDG